MVQILVHPDGNHVPTKDMARRIAASRRAPLIVRASGLSIGTAHLRDDMQILRGADRICPQTRGQKI